MGEASHPGPINAAGARLDVSRSSGAAATLTLIYQGTRGFRWQMTTEPRLTGLPRSSPRQALDAWLDRHSAALADGSIEVLQGWESPDITMDRGAASTALDSPELALTPGGQAGAAGSGAEAAAAEAGPSSMLDPATPLAHWESPEIVTDTGAASTMLDSPELALAPGGQAEAAGSGAEAAAAEAGPSPRLDPAAPPARWESPDIVMDTGVASTMLDSPEPMASGPVLPLRDFSSDCWEFLDTVDVSEEFNK